MASFSANGPRGSGADFMRTVDGETTMTKNPANDGRNSADASPVTAGGVRLPDGWRQLPEVAAYAYSDDRAVEVAIDARPWLLTATKESLSRMEAIEWGGDYEADEVYHLAELFGCPQAGRLADYLSARPTMPNGDTVGFEVHLDREEAHEFLLNYRGDLFAPARIPAAPEASPSSRTAQAAPVLTRKLVGTIAKAFADAGKLTYLQRVDLIAKAAGFANQAALMASLGASERAEAEKTAAAAPGDGKFTVVAAFGANLTGRIFEGFRTNEDTWGNVEERSFSTMEEAKAYLDGLSDMDGWTEYDLPAIRGIPGYESGQEFFEAKDKEPGLDFLTWYNRVSADNETDEGLEP